MTFTVKKAKGRANNKPFVKLYRDILESPEYAKLSSYGVKLLVDIYGQYRGTNNGDFCAAFNSVMKKKGWRSKGTLSRAVTELREKGWIELSRQGGRNKCNLYALSFLSVDECRGKLDIPETAIPSHTWKQKKLISVPQIRTNLPQIRTSGTIR